MHRQGKLRVVHIVRSPIGGIFRHIVDLATAQSEAGHEVGIICDSSTGGAFEDGVIAAVSPRLTFGVRRFPMRRQISGNDVKASTDLFRHLRSLQLDVLHGHGAKGGAYARVIGTALRLGGQRVLRLYCPHGGSLHYDAGTREGQLYFRLERWLERITDGIVFVSGYEEAAYRDKIRIPRIPTLRVANGLRAAEFEPIPPSSEMADLMFAGMMRDLKGPQVLIEAIRILAEDYGLEPTVRFTGAGDDRPAYEARTVEVGLAHRIRFQDPLPTRQALSQGRILVVPSLAESMPYIVLEAIAARIPLVATRVGGIPEIFGRRSPRLVPPGDAAALADAIAHVLHDEAGAHAEAVEFGRELAGRFSLDRMADDIEEFYASLMRPPRAPASGGRPVGSLAPLQMDRRRRLPRALSPD